MKVPSVRREQVQRTAWRFAGLLFILAIPVFLVTSNLRLAFNTERLYTYGFDRYDISEVTGITDDELRRVAGEIITYWNSDAESLEVEVFGQPLYNEREIIHLRDVKGLVRGVYKTQWIAGGLLLAYILGGFLLRRRLFLPLLARRTLVGGGSTLGLLLVVGVTLAIAFPLVFNLFHELSFANDFWRLDPRRDNLVRMFPEGFWFEATMFVALATVLEALALGALGWLGLRLLRRHTQAATQDLVETPQA